MKIINRAAFMAMPTGTVFSKYEPVVFGDLRIKGESLVHDFYALGIADALDANNVGEFVQLCCDSEEKGASIPMEFECMGRDGLFDVDQLFAVWERADVEALIARLVKALEETP